jgi:hypothetical protein
VVSQSSGYAANFAGVEVVVTRPTVKVADWSVIDRGVTPSRGAGVPTLTDLRTDITSLPGRQFGTPTEQAIWREANDQAIYRYRAGIEGPYRTGKGILTVRVEDIDDFIGTMSSRLTVFDASGRRVGRIRREIDADGRGDFAYHALLELDGSVQGSGFADLFNDNLYEWYRRSGIRRVKVHADIDVGSYTWATQGFDFETLTEAKRFLRTARAKIKQALAPGGPTTPLTRQQLADLDAYIARLEADPRSASAIDIAQFGRQPGQSGARGDRWPGNWLLLGDPQVRQWQYGLDWHGVKRL